MREAILRAASHIERNPNALNFTICSMGKDVGCPLVWIGKYSGWTDLHLAQEVARRMIAKPDFRLAMVRHKGTYIFGSAAAEGTFFRRMNELVGEDWTHDATVCAKGLRMYADKYHAEQGRLAA